MSPLETACGNQMKCLLEYQKFNYGLWIGPCIGDGFELKFLLLPVYGLWPIHVDPNIDPNYPDEPNVAFIISMSHI